jgi:AcrR family transcriptional regulator
MINNKHKIVDAMFALSLKNGFDSVSIQEIKEESGVSTGSIYYHFKNKDEILVPMLNRYLMGSYYELKKNVEDYDCTFMEKISFIFNFKTTDFAKKEIEHPYIVRPEFGLDDYFVLLTSIYHQHPEIRPIFYNLHDDLYEFYYGLVQEAIEKSEIRDDIDIRTLVMFIQTTMKGYIDLWVYQPNFPMQELVDVNIKMIWEAIQKR